VVFVTGAASGIGMLTPRVLAARGAAVGVLGRNVAAAEGLVREIEAAGVRALPVDVSKSDDVARAAASLVEAFGGLDTVVSCAGFASAAPCTK
jgi:3-hydroxybutyrate dehydrogenase